MSEQRGRWVKQADGRRVWTGPTESRCKTCRTPMHTVLLPGGGAEGRCARCAIVQTPGFARLAIAEQRRVLTTSATVVRHMDDDSFGIVDAVRDNGYDVTWLDGTSGTLPEWVAGRDVRLVR